MKHHIYIYNCIWVIMFPTLIPQTLTEREHILSFGPKHLFDLSPKLAHLVETVSLESKGFQTGVMLGGAWWRGSSSADAILLSWELKYITGQVVEGSYWPVFWTETGQYLSKMFFPDKLGTLVADFPTQMPTDLANSRDCQMEGQIWFCHKAYKQKPNRNTEENKSEFNIIHIKQKNHCKAEWKHRRKHNRKQINITHITET